MITTRENPDLVRQHLVYEPVLLVDAPRPATGEFVFQRFWFSDPGKRVTLNVSQEANDTNCLSSVTFQPPR